MKEELSIEKTKNEKLTVQYQLLSESAFTLAKENKQLETKYQKLKETWESKLNKSIFTFKNNFEQSKENPMFKNSKRLNCEKW